MIMRSSRMLLGNLENIRRFSFDTLGFLEDHAKDVSRFSIGPHKMCLVNQLDLIESIFLKQGDQFVKPRLVTEFGDIIFGGALTALDGRFWQGRRKAFAKAFTPSAINALMLRSAAQLDSYYQKHSIGQHFKVESYYRKLFIVLYGDLFANCDLSDVTDELSELIESALKVYGDRLQMGIQIPEWIPMGSNSRIRYSMERIREIFSDKLSKQLGTFETNIDPSSVVGVLSQLVNDGSISRKDAIDELLVMIAVGAHQSAIAISWFYYLMARYPEYQSAVFDEVSHLTQIGSTRSDLQHQFKITNACINEALRLFPPFFMIGREAVNDCIVNGETFRKGENILVSAWVTHRDHRYFDSPKAFRPERWLEMRGIPKFAYFPFGIGARTCLAQLLLSRLLPVVVSKFMELYELQLAGSSAVVPKPKVTLGFKKPLVLVASQR